MSLANPNASHDLGYSHLLVAISLKAKGKEVHDIAMAVGKPPADVRQAVIEVPMQQMVKVRA